MAQGLPSLAIQKRVRGLLDFEWYPDPNVVATGLEQAAGQLHTTMDEPLHKSVAVIMEDVARRFDEGAPEWAPWAYEGAQGPRAKYARTYKGKKLMVLSGETEGHTQNPDSYLIANNTVQYIPQGIVDEIHHSSGTYTRNIYPRNYIGLDKTGEDAVVLIFAEWLRDALTAAQAK